MFTQQNLIDRLNQLTIRYNLTWEDIKYDADKAIAKINAFMGTIYPRMSDILLSPGATYTVNAQGVPHEIFPEEYIHSVVIPIIAMEILARDEEFTTVYNKYNTELEDGLFTMFQKEFNRVPLAFRQNPEQGVFFSPDSALGVIQRNDQVNLPVFKFRVYYHVNNTDIVMHTGNFVQDTRAYLYNDTATIKGWNTTLFSLNGLFAYDFIGWIRHPSEVTTPDITVGETLTMKSDIHLYALWNKTSTLNVTMEGIVTIKDTYKPSLLRLEIPERVNNIIVRTIPTHFLKDLSEVGTRHATQLQEIVLPSLLTTIKQEAFKDFYGTSIIFKETPISITYPGITIEKAAFANTWHLTSIILPANIVTMLADPSSSSTFPVVSNKNLIIYCRYLQQNAPIWNADTQTGWHPNWYAYSDSGNNYTVTVVWGAHG
jgi:hypothetical protein